MATQAQQALMQIFFKNKMTFSHQAKRKKSKDLDNKPETNEAHMLSTKLITSPPWEINQTKKIEKKNYANCNTNYCYCIIYEVNKSKLVYQLNKHIRKKSKSVNFF